MFSFRAIALAALLATSTIGTVAVPPTMAQSETAPMTIDELMGAAALDEIFTQFGAAIISAPDQGELNFPSSMRTAWVDAASQVFKADAMHSELAASMDGKLTDAEVAVLAEFYRSPFGQRMTELERAITVLSPAMQETVRAEGQKLMADSPQGTTRNGQIDEMLKLVSSEISLSMVEQSVRGMLIGMALAGQTGDIAVPWDEIDGQLKLTMPMVMREVEQTQRAMTFFAYQKLSDAEMEEYLVFLRKPEAQKFYALAAYSVANVVTQRMHDFGEKLVGVLGRVAT